MTEKKKRKPGGGAKLKYGEKTRLFNIKLPESRREELIQAIREVVYKIMGV